MNTACSDGEPFPAELEGAIAAHGRVRDHYH